MAFPQKLYRVYFKFPQKVYGGYDPELGQNLLTDIVYNQTFEVQANYPFKAPKVGIEKKVTKEKCFFEQSLKGDLLIREKDDKTLYQKLASTINSQNKCDDILVDIDWWCEGEYIRYFEGRFNLLKDAKLILGNNCEWEIKLKSNDALTCTKARNDEEVNFYQVDAFSLTASYIKVNGEMKRVNYNTDCGVLDIPSGENGYITIDIFDEDCNEIDETVNIKDVKIVGRKMVEYLKEEGTAQTTLSNDTNEFYYAPKNEETCEIDSDAFDEYNCRNENGFDAIQLFRYNRKYNGWWHVSTDYWEGDNENATSVTSLWHHDYIRHDGSLNCNDLPKGPNGETEWFYFELVTYYDFSLFGIPIIEGDIEKHLCVRCPRSSSGRNNVNDTIRNGRKLQNVIETFLLNHSCHTRDHLWDNVVSVFWNINVEEFKDNLGLASFEEIAFLLEPYQFAKQWLQNISVHQKTDIKFYNAFETAGKKSMYWTWEHFEDIMNIFNLCWWVEEVKDDNTGTITKYFRIEHKSFIELERSKNPIDLHAQFPKIFENTIQTYNVDNADLPKRESFEWMDEVSDFFKGEDIIYTDDCASNDANKSVKINNFTTDFRAVQYNDEVADVNGDLYHENGNSIDNEGFVLIAYELIGSTNYVIDENWPLGFTILHQKLFTWDRYLSNGKINNQFVPGGFNSTKPIFKSLKYRFPFRKKNNFSFLDSIRTNHPLALYRFNKGLYYNPNNNLIEYNAYNEFGVGIIDKCFTYTDNSGCWQEINIAWQCNTDITCEFEGVNFEIELETYCPVYVLENYEVHYFLAVNYKYNAIGILASDEIHIDYKKGTTGSTWQSVVLTDNNLIIDDGKPLHEDCWNNFKVRFTLTRNNCTFNPQVFTLNLQPIGVSNEYEAEGFTFTKTYPNNEQVTQDFSLYDCEFNCSKAIIVPNLIKNCNPFGAAVQLNFIGLTNNATSTITLIYDNETGESTSIITTYSNIENGIIIIDNVFNFPASEIISLEAIIHNENCDEYIKSYYMSFNFNGTESVDFYYHKDPRFLGSNSSYIASHSIDDC